MRAEESRVHILVARASITEFAEVPESNLKTYYL